MSNKKNTDTLSDNLSETSDERLEQDIVVRVVLSVPVRKIFDYIVPATLVLPCPGCRVRVGFGSRIMTGLVIEVSNSSRLDIKKLKAVRAVLDSEPVLDSKMLQLLCWVADYYIHPLGEVVFSALPKLLREGKSAKLPDRPFWVITALGMEALKQGPGRAAIQHRLLEMFSEAEMPQGSEACKAVSRAWKKAIEVIEGKGLIERAEPPATERVASLPALSTTPDQQQAIDSITASLGRFKCFLLHGITGSGKTEVYLRCIRAVLERNQQALILVPEISLTPQLVDRFRQRFEVVIDVLHSGMNDTQRMRAWARARCGSSAVLIGTRSAVFVPLARPGIIILDEEHDSSFKQQDGFRYHARDVAIKRASMEGIPVVMGSATPSLESWHNANQNRFGLLRLEQRATAGGLPEIHLLDIEKQPLENGISIPLRDGVRQGLERGEQSLLFVNRRGFAPAVCCTSCNTLVQCTRCDARMTWHKKAGRLLCHHCGKSSQWPEHCSDCGGGEMVTLGQGTENIQQTIQQMVPGASIERIDRDSTRRKGELERRLKRAHNGEADVLVGTQMLSKGHDFPNLSLVGILDSDQLLFSSDFRASERLFQLITQVAGRAGRADKQGTVLVQTRFPDSPWLQAIAQHDYKAFARMALKERKSADYPPYTHIALLRAEATKQQEALKFLEAMHCKARSLIVSSAAMRPVNLSEPVPSVMEKRAGRYRAQLLVQAASRKPLHDFLYQWRGEIESDRSARRVRWSLDVDPVDLY
ncbi:MAG: primosomal protein N' [Gammaproteobacteria bacterium]|nr:primosomal protein N' [Gammaproteobacteria bacterium]